MDRRPAGFAGGAAPARSSTAGGPPGWAAGLTGRGVRVAVIDSGWDRSLPDPRVRAGVAFGPDGVPGSDDGDRTGHGTGVTHQLLAVAPGADVVPVRVFGDTLECSPRALVAAIDWAVEQRAAVVNLSLGTAREDALRPLYAACERARRAGAVVVAAGDNFGEVSYPAVFDPVIGVDMGEFASPFEFRWRPGEALEIEAWGVRVPVAGLGGARVVSTGTSVAAANVSGIVALLLERRPGLGVDEIRRLLASHAVA